MSYCSANPVMSSSSQPKMTCHSTSRGRVESRAQALKLHSHSRGAQPITGSHLLLRESRCLDCKMPNQKFKRKKIKQERLGLVVHT